MRLPRPTSWLKLSIPSKCNLLSLLSIHEAALTGYIRWDTGISDTIFTMTYSHESREDNSLYLPQYGFGQTLDFANLVERNQFLFRVYTPKERSPFFDDTEPFFVAPRFDERYRNTTPGGLKEWETDGRAAVTNATYEDIARHLNWTTRSLSPYISTSFSPIWSIWEAVRRYHCGVKQDVEIAIIDAHAVSDRAVTAAHLLSKASSQE